MVITAVKSISFPLHSDPNCIEKKKVTCWSTAVPSNYRQHLLLSEDVGQEEEEEQRNLLFARRKVCAAQESVLNIHSVCL